MRIELKHQAQVNGFLRTLPAFKTWPMKWCSKLQYYLVEINCVRNQVIYHEGDCAEHVYLI